MELGSWLTGTTEGLTDLALFIVRIFIGTGFVVHGLGKLGLVGTGNMAGFQGWLEELGVPLPALTARMTMLSEITGGTCLALGLFARPGCILLIVVMAAAGFTGHKGAGYLITNDPPGAEYTINLAAVCFMLLLTGPGALALDTVLF